MRPPSNPSLESKNCDRGAAEQGTLVYLLSLMVSVMSSGLRYTPCVSTSGEYELRPVEPSSTALPADLAVNLDGRAAPNDAGASKTPATLARSPHCSF